MVFISFFLFEFFVLFLLSRTLTTTLSRFLPIQAFSFLFLPGVVIHELSHLLTAAILFVPVGEIEFMPKEREGGVKLGSVEIGSTDPIRRAIVGFAPVLVGIIVVLELINFVTDSSSIVRTIELNSILKIAIFIAVFYLVFAISNTMFSSSKDMEGTVTLIVALLTIAILLYFSGVRIPFNFLSVLLSDRTQRFFQTADIFLAVPVLIDVLIIGAVRFIRK